MKKILIWTSDVNVDDHQDFFDDAYPDITDDFEKWQICHEINNELLEDERRNLDYDHPVLAIADIGRWNGRRQGYKVFDNLKDILYTESDGAEWYVEGMTLKGTLWDHDGTTYVKYYLFNDELPGAEKFMDDIARGVNITKSRLYHYCKSAGKVVRDIYGFGKVV